MHELFGTQDRDGGFELALSGHTVSRCIVDVQFFGLQFFDMPSGADLLIALEGDFHLKDTSGKWCTCASTTDVARAVGLLSKRVQRVMVQGSGTLAVVFSDGTELTAPPHPEFEAWEIRGSDGFLVVCTPGGGLAIFHPADRTKP